MKSPENTRILIIAESIDINDSSGTKGRIALIQNLQKIGYNLKVYHYSRKNIKLNGIECISIKEKRKSFLFLLSRVERYIRYFLKIELNKPLEKVFGFSFTLMNDRNSIAESLKNNKNFEPDLIFTLSKGGSFRPHHALLKFPQWHDRWVAYMHDPYPMHMYPKPFPWKEPGFKQKEEFIRQVSEQAAFPVFPSLLLQNWMGEYFPGFKEKGRVIPHQLNEQHLEINEIPAFFDKSKFNLLHAGNLLQARQPKGLVEGFELFLSINPGAAKFSMLSFVGPAGHHKTYLDQKCCEIPGLFFINENKAFDEVSLLQRETTVNIIIEAKSDISPFLPGKFPHCIKSNKIILHLGPENSETKRILGEDYRYWAEIDDKKKIAVLIEELYYKWKENKELSLDRKDIEEYLSVTHLKTVIEDMLSSS